MLEYARILCAVDYSESSGRALDFALWWARWHGADLSVLHVHQQVGAPPDTGLIGSEASAGTVPPPVVSPVPLAPQEREAMIEKLEDLVARRRTDGVQVELLLDEDTSVADAVMARADALACDLIVMGITGSQSAPGQPALGPETAAVIHGAGRSVLCVPAPPAGSIDPHKGGLHRIVCPVSFSDPSRLALAVAAGLNAQADAHLTVMHVVELSEVAASAYDFDAYREARIQPACLQFVTLVSDTIGDTAAVEEIVVTGVPDTEILKIAHEREADLLVLGAAAALVTPAARGTLDKVVRETLCPVLVAVAGPPAEVRPDRVRAAHSVDAAR